MIVLQISSLSQELRVALEDCFKNIVPSSVKKLGKAFDLELAIEQLCRFKVKNGKLIISREDRIEWEANGASEFGEIYRHVCMLPPAQAPADENHDLNFLPHDSVATLKKFKIATQKILWEKLRNAPTPCFLTVMETASSNSSKVT